MMKTGNSLKTVLRRIIGIGCNKLKTFYLNLKYCRFKPNHVFHINVNGVEFNMSFSNYKLQGAIVERIEGRRERETVAIIKSIVHEGAKVLELGGCYGYFTIIMSKCVGSKGQVVSIEGTPNNYKILSNNLKINNIRNVITYNVFITGNSEFVTFNPMDSHPYDAIRRLESNNNAEIKVKTVQVASFLSQINFKPDYIFMDIEGFEVEVFESLSNFHFSQNKPIIVFEVHNDYYKKGKDLNYIINILQENKYIHRRIAGNIICFPQAMNTSSENS